MATTLYGLRIRKEGSFFGVIDNNAGIFLVDAFDHALLIPNGAKVSWGSFDDPSLINSIYFDGDILYQNVGGVQTPIGGGTSTSSTMFASAEGATVVNDATETTLVPSVFNGTTNIDAGALTAYKVFRIVARGIYSADAVAPTIKFRLKLDTTTIIETDTITLGGGAADAFWQIETDIAVRIDDAIIGEIVGGGTLSYTSGSNYKFTPMTLSTPVTFDTTQATNIDLTVEWGTADADNTITCQIMTIEVLNAP